MRECELSLNGYGIHMLRELGRKIGVRSPSLMRKEELITKIVGVRLGIIPAEPLTNRGAPPKQALNTDEIENALEFTIKKYELQEIACEVANNSTMIKLSDSEQVEPTVSFFDKMYSGKLDIHPNGYGFLRAIDEENEEKKDVYVPVGMIKRYKLVIGDDITCYAKDSKDNGCPALTRIISINGENLGAKKDYLDFDSMVSCYPREKLVMERKESNNLSLRCIDLLSPIGMGQRGLIVSPPKAGKTTLLKDIAHSIEENYPDMKMFILLIDERPEEVTDFKNSVKNAEVVYSTFDEGSEHHIKVANQIFSKAKRLVEWGKNVVILLDSLTKLTRAYNNVVPSSGRTLSGGLDPAALIEPKKFFGYGRNLENGASLTVLATALVDTGSRMEEVIYEEFKGTGNMEIHLSRDLAEKRIFPAIDLQRSGTRHEELLLNKEELDCSYKIRKLIGRDISTDSLFDVMKKTNNNKEFIERLDDWLKIYKSK